jgi:hypothetical protein
VIWEIESRLAMRYTNSSRPLALAGAGPVTKNGTSNGNRSLMNDAPRDAWIEPPGA